jgi:Sulfatase
VVEPITDLCPTRLCADVRPGAMDRLRSLESDLEVVVQHLLLPEDLRDGLPAVDRVWEGFETGSVSDAGELRGGSDLKHDVLARLARDDATAGFERAIASLERGSRPRPPLLFLHSTLPHAGWRYLPDGRRYVTEGKEFPGLASQGWIGPQWQVDQGFQRHVLQVQYVDRLLGRLLDALESAGIFDDAVVVVTADHGASFVTGEPRRPANRANVGAIAPVPFFAKAPGQRDGRVDDGAVRTIDVLPTIAAAAGVRVPWKADGIPAEERAVDPAAPIDVSHAGEPALTEPLREVLAKRRARDAVEERLLRGGVWAIGPRPDLLGRPVPMRPGAPPRPPFASGELNGPPPGAELALAVDGRVVATTRVYRNGDRSLYTALVPPSPLRDGANPVRVFHVVGDELRPLD